MDVKKLVYEKLSKLTKQEFNDSSDIYGIGIDSLDLVEMITDAEDEYNITINDEDLLELKTVGDVIKIIEKQVK